MCVDVTTAPGLATGESVLVRDPGQSSRASQHLHLGGNNILTLLSYCCCSSALNIIVILA